MKETTELWKYYDAGRAYNNSLNPSQYNLVNTNREFFNGNQWINLPESEAMARLPKPTFNIIGRITQTFVASLTSNNFTIRFDALSYSDPNGTLGQGPFANEERIQAATLAEAEVRNFLEKVKIDYRIRDALFDGAVTGDYCAHFLWNPDALPYGGEFGPCRGEIEMEMVDGINVMFGNPCITDVEKQPYIVIVGRATMKELKEEYKSQHGSEPDNLRPDGGMEHPDEFYGSNDSYHAAADEDSKLCTYIYVYRKEAKWEECGCGEKHRVDHVLVSKSTRDCVIYEDVDTGLSRYPVAWGNWEKHKNRYHGKALVTGIIPNQIYINTMMAMVFRNMMTQSFPKVLFNADVLPRYNNEVGTAIGIRNLQPEQKLDEVVSSIRPSDMSSQIMISIDKCMQYTKECMGATDAQMGTANANNTSAIMVLQNASEVPLENIRAGLHEWLEDIGAILLDMMGTYYGERPILVPNPDQGPPANSMQLPGEMVLNPQTMQMEAAKPPENVLTVYDFSKFKRLWMSISADVGATNYYSEIATVQTLDNLRKDGFLSAVDYLERVPDKLIPRKQELIDELKGQAAQATGPGMSSVGSSTGETNQNMTMGAQLSDEKLFQQIPQGLQAQYDKLPSVAQRALIRASM